MFIMHQGFSQHFIFNLEVCGFEFGYMRRVKLEKKTFISNL